MQTLETLRRRIENAEDMQSVVTTMKTLAAVSIRQYEEAVESLSEYSRTVHAAFRMLLQDPATYSIRRQPDRRGGVGAIVFGSDQGLCGRFNEDVADFAKARLQEGDDENGECFFLVVGGRVHGRLQDAGFPIDGLWSLPGSIGGLTPLVQEMLPRIERWESERRLSRVLVFYNRRVSATSYEPQQLQMLPLDLAALPGPKSTTRCLPLVTMDRGQFFSSLVRQHLFVSLYRACAESQASENASRIASMQAAEKNIEDRLGEFRTQFHHLRQTSITQELLEVVTGFEALTQQADSPND